MSIATVEIRSFSGPDLVELDGVNRPAIIRLNVGPAGPAGPNSVTSATTSDGTCDLWLDTLKVGTGTASGAYSVAIGTDTTASGNSSFGSGFNSVASGDYSVAIGSNVEASGYISYAFGDFSIASADYAYAIGVDSRAIHIGASVETDSQQGAVESITTDEKVFSFLNGYRFLGGSAAFDGTVIASHIHGNLAGSVYTHIRAGEALTKGDPVYISGSHGSGSTLIPIVSKADASNVAKMPAVGIVDADIANNANGHMVIVGTITELNTNAYAVNDTLYVASGGGFTATPPAANSQPVARVERSNTTNGAVIVKVNGLASSGGNGASDANKLVRFSSSGTIPVASIGGLGTGIATFLATPSSANLAAAVTDETGSGSLVFASSPTLTSPTLTGTPNFTATNYTFAADARIAFLNSLSSEFVYKNGTIPFAEIFEDFPVTTGTHGFISAGGTVAYYAPSSTNAARYWGAVSLTTGATTDNTAIITLAPSGGANGQTTSRFELSHQVCFCVNNATSSEFRARLQGSGQTFDCAVLFGTGVVQLEATNIGGAGVNSVSVATGLTLAAGDFISGTRYRLFVRCISATQTEVYFASAPWNSSTWTTLADTTVTHSSITLTNVSSQPVYFVTTKTNAARIAYVDWVAIRYAIQR